MLANVSFMRRSPSNAVPHHRALVIGVLTTYVCRAPSVGVMANSWCRFEARAPSPYPCALLEESA